MKTFRSIVLGLINSLGIILVVLVLVVFTFSIYFVGYRIGYNNAVADSQVFIDQMLQDLVSSQQEKSFTWTGPELWDAVNKSRQEKGVSVLTNEPDLCTIASIRLNELLELGKLDAHEGFSKLVEEREDLKPIFEKYNMAEFLVYGGNSAEEAVDLWENTLGHSKLLTGGEYVWGCTYAQNGFGVAIAAY